MYVCWGATNLVLFVPMFAVGSLIPFPPLVFGASVAWWLLATGVVGLLLLAIFSKRIFGARLALKEEIAGAFTKEGAFLTFTLFLALVAVIAALDVGLDFRFRIITPILRSFSPISRAFVFPTFIPFLLPYFLAEGLYIHRLTSGLPSKHVPRGSARDFAFSIFGKISPFVLLIGLQYTLKLAFDVWLLPSFVGFLLEFVWLIVPIFAIATSFSWWFQKHTGNALSGALFNALLMSWVAAVVFPF
jgi:hypothetical protein